MAKILVVDDRPINRQFLVTLLGYSGHQLLEAADGKEALATARASRPDLVITDILMPTMDGIEFTKRLRAEPSIAATPVIFYTATFRLHEARLLAKGCGVSFVLAKPSEPQLILSMVNTALGLTQTETIPPCDVLQPEETPAEKLLIEYLSDLESFNQAMNSIIDRGKKTLVSEHERLRSLSEKLNETSNQLHTVGLRLVALTELGQELAAERDPDRLVNLFCRAAHDIITSKSACLRILSEDATTPGYFLSRGLTPEAHDRSAQLLPSSAFVRRVVETRLPCRASASDLEFEKLGLPAVDPSARSVLGVPIVITSKVVGWLYLADRLVGDEFSDDDERLALTLAAQLAVSYENAQLYQKIKKHAAELEIEVAKRRVSEKQVQQLNADLEGRVVERTAQLNEANQELEAFSYSVSHDLRAPLRAIESFSKALQIEHCQTIDSEGQRLLSTIRSETKRMGTLIDHLLDFSRLGRQPMTRVEIDMTELAQKAFEELANNQGEPALEFFLSPLPRSSSDPTLIRQVFVNLLSNAIKFSRGETKPHIEVGGSSAVGTNTYYVKDNGVGFDEKYSDKLFGVFQRLHGEDEFEGNGVGLSLVQRIIQRHGGKVWAHSKPGQGATFFFTLPADNQEALHQS